jgi:hypothetical protein
LRRSLDYLFIFKSRTQPNHKAAPLLIYATPIHLLSGAGGWRAGKKSGEKDAALAFPPSFLQGKAIITFLARLARDAAARSLNAPRKRALC